MRSAGASLVIKATNALLAFSTAVVLARILGPSGYGIYSFSLAVLMLSAIPAQVGIPQLITRETAKAQTQGHFGLMLSLWRWGNLAVIAFSILVITIIAILLSITNESASTSRTQTLFIGLLLIPLIALANVRGACLRGLRKIIQGQLPESVIRPAFLLALISLTWYYTEEKITPEKTMGIYLIAASLAFVVGIWLLKHARPKDLTSSLKAKSNIKVWVKAAIPLALIAGLELINKHADLIILGIFRSNEEVGIYRVVFQVSMLTGFGLHAINQVIQPYMARLYTQGDNIRLQHLATISARLALFAALFPTILFVMFGSDLLRLVFGQGYHSGAVALILLSIGQLFSSAIGSVGTLLNMTGHEKDTIKGISIAVVANLTMNILLIPEYGASGAATATMLTLILWNYLLRKAVHMRLGIESSAAGPNFKNIKKTTHK